MAMVIDLKPRSINRFSTSFYITLPIEYVRTKGLHKGSLLKCSVDDEGSLILKPEGVQHDA